MPKSELSRMYYSALERTKRHHAQKQGKTFSGRFSWKQRHRIKEIIQRFDVETMLDYGCGYGKQYQERDENGLSLTQYWGIDPVKYDPGVPHFATEPVGKFDLVICVQVLGSIPTRDLPPIIDRLYSHATKAIYVVERIGQPHKRLFDDIREEMPFGISAEAWLELLARPGSPVRMIAAFHNPDGTAGWPGWRLEEPEGQGS